MQRGPHFGHKDGVDGAGVPELVGRPGRHDQAVPRLGRDRLPADLKPDVAFEHFESLLLVRMDVLGRDRAAGLNHRLDDHELAVGSAAV